MKYDFNNDADRDFPSMVVAEICNVCNLRCTHCGCRKVIESSEYKPYFLELDIFKRVVDEVVLHKNSFLRFTSDGEPLLHPQILDMVKYAKLKGIFPVTINTNGLLLDNNTAMHLLESGIDVIEISINAFTKETYNKFRINADYDTLMKNIENIIFMKKSKNYNTKLMVSTINFPGYEEEVKQFDEFWSGKADKVIIRTFFDHQGLVDNICEKKLKSIDRFPCPQFWKRITVAANGWLKYCVNDWFNKTKIADLRTGITIQEIWNSDEYKKMRERQIKGEYDKINICGSCTDWQAMDWNYDYNFAINELTNPK